MSDSENKAGKTAEAEGHANLPVSLDTSNMTIDDTVNAKVHFDGSNASFHNTVGMYTYDDKGNVTSTQILFGDVSAQGVAGGASNLSVHLQAGEHIGFFIAPNAAGLADMLGMMKQGGSFHLVNTTDGQTANVNSGVPMQLAYDSPTGQWSNVHTQYWTSVFSTSTADNQDGLQHAHVTTDPVTGQLHVQFEDQLGGGDNSFANASFSINIGKDNAKDLAHDVLHPAAAVDHIAAADMTAFGHDTLLGPAMSGYTTDPLHSGHLLV